MSKIGPYIIEAELGRGGMGVVYRARHDDLARPAALKVLRSVPGAEQLEHRFLREAKLMTRVHHPNVVRILDFGETDAYRFIGMELLDGITLEELLKTPPLPSRKVLDRIALGVTTGLGALHTAGIIHRDLKPSNVMITREGVPKLMDLGLARTAASTVLTQAGNVSGTIAYMPPEAGWIAEFTPCYDVYQMGLILHLLYTGAAAFEKPPLSYMMRKEPVPEPAILAMKTELGPIEDVIRRCLCIDPLDRYPDGSSLAADLEKAVDPEATLRRFPMPAEEETERTRPLLPTMDPKPAIDESELSTSLHVTDVTAVGAGRLVLVSCLMLVAGLAAVLALSRESTIPGPIARTDTPASSPAPTETPAASPPASTPALPPEPTPKPVVSYLEWLDLTGTVKLEDSLSLGTGSAARRKLFEEPRMRPFLDELRSCLQDSEQNALATAYFSDVEYWPSPPLPAESFSGIWIESLERAGQPSRLAARPPGPIRRIILRLRPAEKYRLHFPGGAVEIHAPERGFSRDVTFYEGMDNVTLRHNAMGRASKVVMVRRDTGLPPASTIGPEVTPASMTLIRHQGLADDEPLVILFFQPPGPETRLVLGRIKWHKGSRKKLLENYRSWLSSVNSVRLTQPNLVAQIRGLSTVVSPSGATEISTSVDYKDLVIDGKHFAHPDALVTLEELAMSSHPQLKRGAISVLGMQWPRRNIERFKKFLAEASEPEDWIHAVEALSRAGDPLAVDQMLRRLGTGQTSTALHWSRTYARGMPQDLLDLLDDPERAAKVCSPDALRLVDQTAAILGGRIGGDYLASIPDDRLLGAGRFSLILALRLIATPRALKRLDDLGKRIDKRHKSRR